VLATHQRLSVVATHGASITTEPPPDGGVVFSSLAPPPAPRFFACPPLPGLLIFTHRHHYASALPPLCCMSAGHVGWALCIQPPAQHSVCVCPMLVTGEGRVSKPERMTASAVAERGHGRWGCAGGGSPGTVARVLVRTLDGGRITRCDPPASSAPDPPFPLPPPSLCPTLFVGLLVRAHPSCPARHNPVHTARRYAGRAATVAVPCRAERTRVMARRFEGAAPLQAVFDWVDVESAEPLSVSPPPPRPPPPPLV
jgi:hypothetical protein